MDQTVTIFFDFDCCPSELSWEIRDNHNQILAQHQYTADIAIPSYGQAQERINMKDGVEYTLKVMDEAGDGFEENAGMYEVFRGSESLGWKDRVLIARIRGNFGHSIVHTLTDTKDVNGISSPNSFGSMQSMEGEDFKKGSSTTIMDSNSNWVGLVSFTITFFSLLSILVLKQKLKNRQKGKGVIGRKLPQDHRVSDASNYEYLDCMYEYVQQQQQQDRTWMVQDFDIPVFVEVQLCS